MPTLNQYATIEPGTKFNRLTVLGFAEFVIRKSGVREAAFLCRCDCGKEKVITGAKVRSGQVKSCGCLPAERMSKLSSQLSVDLTGNQFGKLNVIKKLGVSGRSGAYMYQCRCACGRDVVLDGTYLRNGRNTTCGAWECEENMEAALNAPDVAEDHARNAYFAGHFDGEGSIMFGPPGKGQSPGLLVRVSGVYKPTIEEYVANFGGVMKIVLPTQEGHCRVQWTWICMAQDKVLRFINCILPYSREKRAQLELGLNYLMERIKCQESRLSAGLLAKIPDLKEKMAHLKQYEFRN